jgi:hypothetical protein
VQSKETGAKRDRKIHENRIRKKKKDEEQAHIGVPFLRYDRPGGLG